MTERGNAPTVKTDSRRDLRPSVPPPAGGGTPSDQADGAADSPTEQHDSHEGATEEEVGDRTGPGAGYDQEPEQEKDEGGVA